MVIFLRGEELDVMKWVIGFFCGREWGRGSFVFVIYFRSERVCFCRVISG